MINLVILYLLSVLFNIIVVNLIIEGKSFDKWDFVICFSGIIGNLLLIGILLLSLVLTIIRRK